jgi:hypothetical protein
MNKTIIVNNIIKRIAEADPCSPIAVFVVDRELKAVFANTSTTAYWLRSNKHPCIGIFSKKDNLNDVYHILYAAVL